MWTTGDDPCNNVSALWVQRLNPDGISLTGERVSLLTEDQYWEQGGLENPVMVRHGDKYDLLYSANRWDRPDYAVGYALCDTPMGPCRKPQSEEKI